MEEAHPATLPINTFSSPFEVSDGSWLSSISATLIPRSTLVLFQTTQFYPPDEHFSIGKRWGTIGQCAMEVVMQKRCHPPIQCYCAHQPFVAGLPSGLCVCSCLFEASHNYSTRQNCAVLFFSPPVSASLRLPPRSFCSSQLCIKCERGLCVSAREAWVGER